MLLRSVVAMLLGIYLRCFKMRVVQFGHSHRLPILHLAVK